MNNNIACVISNDNICSFEETVNAIKKAGFKKCFIQWYNDNRFKPNQDMQLEMVKQLGLEIVFAHLGYQNINDIWEDNEEGELLVDRYKKDIKICHNNGINLVVMHPVAKTEAPKYNEIGLKRIKKICSYAKRLGVKVAFENTKIKGYLEYIMDNIKSDNVGLCLDFGHLHAHFNDEYSWDKFKGRIIAVHIHDNHGSRDEHLLPYDGTVDYKMILKNLKESSYDGPITLEICYLKDYENIDVIDFYKKGYKLGKDLEKLFKEI